MEKNPLNFIITGYGRSGTKFLSNIMNKSKKWTVLHEPRGNEEANFLKNKYTTLTFARNAFKKSYYGEVNSYLRYFLDAINVDKKALVLRDPLEIFTSVANRKTLNTLPYYIDDIKYWYSIFNIWKKNGVKCYYFENFTTDVNYLKNFLIDFGITDVNMSDIDINRKINKKKFEKYETFNDLPSHIKIKAQDLINYKL